MARVPLFVVGLDYGPREPSDESPLLVYIKCRSLAGDRVNLTVEGTKPRFWTEQRTDRPTKFTSIEGTQLYEVRIDYPWQRRDAARTLFPTYCADYPYSDMCRFVYGWEAVIEVDEERLKQNRIRPVHIHKSEHEFTEFPLKVMGFDIETADTLDMKETPESVVSIAISEKNYYTEYQETIRYEVCSIVKTSERLVKRMLGSQEVLEGFVEHDTPIPPVAPELVSVRSVHDEDDPECALFWWFKLKLDEIDPDVILGHNARDYDVKYMRNRARRRNRELQADPLAFKFPVIAWNNLQLMDSMRMYAEQVQGTATVTRGGSLAWMAASEIGYGKVPRTRIKDMMENDPEMLAVYNIWDVVVVDRVMDVMHLVEFYRYKACMHFSEINCAHSYIVMIENRTAHTLWDMGMVMPSLSTVKHRMKDDPVTFQGGFVMEAQSNVWEHAFELDNSKEYPSCIITGNLDPATRVHNPDAYDGEFPWPVTICPSGRVYRRDIEGFIPNVLRELALKRDQVQADMRATEHGSPERKVLNFQQRVLKENMNSWYGVLGSGNTFKTEDRPFRLTDKAIAADITEIARVHNKWNKQHIDSATLYYDQYGVHPIETDDSIEMKFEVIYQDTDSCKVAVVNMDALNELRAFEKTDCYSSANLLCDMLNKSYDRFVQETLNAPSNVFFEVKPDAYYRRYFQWGRKKRYAYVDYDEHYGYRGVEIRRSSSTQVVKMFQEGLFEVILGGGDRIAVNQYIREFEGRCLTAEFSDLDFGRPHGFNTENKTTQTYKAVQWSNRNLDTEFVIGDKPVLFIALSAPKPLPKGKVVALPYGDVPADYNIVVDRLSGLKKLSTSQAIAPILDAMGTSWENAMAGMSTATFGDWFK